MPQASNLDHGTWKELPDKATEGATAINESLFPPIIFNVITEHKAKIPIYIYNTANLTHNVSRPPNHPHMYIKPCPEGQEYVLAGQIEHPFTEIEWDQNGNKIINDNVDGFKEATRMLSPMNWGVDQNLDTEDGTSYGLNLNNYGVFWSVNNPPTEQELRAARARTASAFEKELARMADIEAKDPQHVHQYVNNISRAAADMFPEDRSWKRIFKAKNDLTKTPCPVCSEEIFITAAKCRFCGAIFDEERALEYGATPRKPGRPKVQVDEPEQPES